MKMYPMIMLSMITMNLIMISSQSLLTMWIMMEMSSLMFTSMCCLEKESIKSIPSIMPMQFTSASGMLVSIILEPTQMLWSSLMSLSIMVKMGIFPFDTWMINAFKEMSWKMCMTMMTMMKIPPMMMISTINESLMMMVMNSISPIIMAMKMIPLNSPKMILSMSSSMQSSWMINSMMVDQTTWAIYFMVYSMTIVSAVMSMKNNNPQLNWFNNPEKMNKANKTMMMIMITSLMGIPPMILFSMKAKAIMEMGKEMTIPTISLILSSSMSMLFYSRIMMTLIMINHTTMKKLKSNYKMSMIMMLPTINLITMMLML